MGDFEVNGTVLVRYTGCEKEVRVPDGITELKADSFSSCGTAERIILPRSVKIIGKSAFDECVALKSIDLGSVKEIREWAFHGCQSLAEVIIPDGTEKICGQIFNDCVSLRRIHVSATVTEIAQDALDRCYSLASITVSENNRFYRTRNGALTSKDGRRIVKYPPQDPRCSVKLDRPVEVIGARAFEGCSFLTSVTLGKSIRRIGENAFNACPLLREAVFEGTCGRIEEGAFSGYKMLSDPIVLSMGLYRKLSTEMTDHFISCFLSRFSRGVCCEREMSAARSYVRSCFPSLMRRFAENEDFFMFAAFKNAIPERYVEEVLEGTQSPSLKALLLDRNAGCSERTFERLDVELEKTFSADGEKA